MSRLHRPSALLAALFVLAHSLAAAPARYTVIPLGDFGDSNSSAHAINASGQLVGSSIPTSDDGEDVYSTAFFYSHGAIAALPNLGTAASDASDINDASQIVGSSYIGGEYEARHAFLYAAGAITDLGVLGDPANASQRESFANAINSAGQIVGASAAPYAMHAFLYSGGAMADLGTLGGGSSVATALNDAGQVVGYSSIPSGESHAFLFLGGGMIDLGALNGTASGASAINNRGQIVGSFEPKGNSYYSHAFLYSGRKMKDLGTLGGKFSSAKGINDHGDIVGESDPAGKSNRPHAFLYSNGKMTDLNDLVSPDSKWVVQYASAISDTGLIAAAGTPKGASSSLRSALLLAPIPILTVSGGERRITHQAKIILRGRADRSVSRVVCKRDSKHASNAVGIRNWHLALKLRPGKNQITVIAYGLGGNTTRKSILITRS